LCWLHFLSQQYGPQMSFHLVTLLHFGSKKLCQLRIFYLLCSWNLVVWIQKIQYAKTKSDIVAKADGTFAPRERRKRVDEKRKMLANMPFVLHSLFNWCPVCWLAHLFIYISCCLTDEVVIHVCLVINVFALPCTLMFTTSVDLEIKDLSLTDPSHMKT